MKHTLLTSVAALALAASSTIALSQGGGAQMPNPSGQSGGSMSRDSQPTDTQRGAQERTGQERQPKSTQTRPEQPTTQQRQQTQSPTQQRQTESPTQQRQTESPTQQRQTDTKQPGAKQGQAQQQDRPMASSNVSLTTEQRTTIRNTVLTGTAPRVTNVNFDIRVGTVVPRTVRIVPVPATLIQIEPTWRGYMYFVYHDEIIIVEPGTLRIVAVLEV